MPSRDRDPTPRSRRRRRPLTRCGYLAVLAVTLAATGCGTSTNALDRSSDEVKDVLAAIEAADPPGSYRFTYTAISPLFMACMSGVEDVQGAVDAQASVMVLETLQRPGDVYSLDGELLVHRDLLDLTDDGRGDYARIALDATTDTATRDRIDAALGTSLSALVAGGAWPNHPTDTVMALIPLATSITSIDPDQPSQRAIRLVLDAEAYTSQSGETTGPATDTAPIIDVHVAADGTISRFVARLPNPADPTTLEDHSDGYAVDYDYDAEITITPPGVDATFNITARDMPAQPTPIPCQVEQ